MMRQFFILIILGLIFFFGCQENNKIEFYPIGYYQTPYSLKTGAPRQGTLIPETHGKIILDEKYTEGLQELLDFEYIWVIYVFDQTKGWDLIVRPPKSHNSFGVFATRSPRRPNPVGLSLNRLDSIQGNILFVSGIDVFDNTPILDIKPFLPSVDYVKSPKTEAAEEFLGHHDEDYINDTMVKEFVKGKK